MAMKKKKMEKSIAPKIAKDVVPARKTAMKAKSPATDSARPALSGISRSLETLLGRTKAYFLSTGKAEA